MSKAAPERTQRVKFAVSKDGYSFDVTSDLWRLNKDVAVSPVLPESVSAEVGAGFRAVLQRYAEEMSARHTENMCTRLKKFFRETGAAAPTPVSLTNWRARLGADEWQLGGLKGFLLSWHDYGYPGVSDEAVDLLRSWRIRGNDKGAAVAGGCPYTGPMTDLEVAAVLNWANTAVVNGSVQYEEYAYVLTLLVTARRSTQIAALRGRDLLREDGESNQARLRVPRAKQRGGGFRRHFRELPIPDDLASVLHQQWLKSLNRIEACLGAKIDAQLAGEIPIFLSVTSTQRIAPGSDMRELLLGEQPDRLHVTTSALNTYLKRFAAASTARSERTGDFIRLTATRFRRTRGTKLRREGFGPFIIAELLDHSDVQNVRVYTENTAQEAVVIDELVGAQLAPYAQACLGTLVNSEREAIRGNDPKSRVANARQNGVGTCGNYGFCASGYKACYTCYHFQPWVDGPHEEVLADLYAEKALAQDAGCSTVVVEANDQLILAVEHCVSLCRGARQSVARDEVEVLRG